MHQNNVHLLLSIFFIFEHLSAQIPLITVPFEHDVLHGSLGKQGVCKSKLVQTARPGDSVIM